MKTNRLYYDDAYLTEFDAQVCAVREDGWVALDQSAFYPTSGGQPYDTGVLGGLPVTDVQVENDVVWHKVEGVLEEGQRVHGRIDWARRFEHMQQHAADHMLAGAAYAMYGGVTIGLHLGTEDATIDMTLPGGRTHLTQEEVDELERVVNARVQQNDEIRCRFPDEKELETLPLRKKPTVTEHVRIVAMGDYEMVACGGTHPRTTGEMGLIKIISTSPARGKMRLCFVAGMRALRYVQACAKCAVAVSQAVSSDMAGALDALLHERENAAEARKELNKKLTGAALAGIRAGAETLPDGRVLYAQHVDFADNEVLMHAAQELTREENALVLLTCPRKDARMAIFARGSAAGEDMGKLLRASGVRGGGKPDMAQGSCADGAALEEAVRVLTEGDHGQA